jgi:Flp pilus assembly protein TadG
VLLETAFVLPIFLVLILAIMELGTVFFVRHAMLNAARDAVRSLSIGELDASGAAALAQQRLPSVNLSFAVTTSADSDTSLDRWVDISTPLSGAALNDPLGLFGDGQLQVRVTMRREDS